MSQTGGGCRASNYIAFIRRALKKTGMEQVPVISINLSGLESNPGFKLTLPLIKNPPSTNFSINFLTIFAYLFCCKERASILRRD